MAKTSLKPLLSASHCSVAEWLRPSHQEAVPERGLRHGARLEVALSVEGEEAFPIGLPQIVRNGGEENEVRVIDSAFLEIVEELLVRRPGRHAGVDHFRLQAAGVELCLEQGGKIPAFRTASPAA